MKTAEEWNWLHTTICANNPAVHGQLLPAPQMVAFIEGVQLEAWKQGMTDAVEILNNDPDPEACNSLMIEEIEKARDSKTSL